MEAKRTVTLGRRIGTERRMFNEEEEEAFGSSIFYIALQKFGLSLPPDWEDPYFSSSGGQISRVPESHVPNG